MDDLLRDFLAESTENLAQLDQDVVGLERDPSNASLLNSIFRVIHTIKGTCGFLGLPRLEAVSHTAESVLELLRRGELKADPDVVSDILRAVDVIKLILAGLEANGVEPSGDDSLLVALLEQWLVPASVSASVQQRTDAQHASSGIAYDRIATTTDESRSGIGAATMTTQFPAGPTTDQAAPVAASIRVNVTLLDALMNLAGELVLSRNQLLEMSSRDEDSIFGPPVQQLSRITAELQGAVMKTRMQPVGSAWGKLPRIVRDIARETGKKIELDMKGAATELDRQLVQALQDPLTHMVRNSADHGIESPEERLHAGKPATGRIVLNAFHEAGHVIVEIIDDGRGIDATEIRRLAVERGLVQKEAARTMADCEVLRFVFEPGFSTAAAVTHISGRGVGMDVVRSNIERVGGAVDIHSVNGHGCTVRIRLPLTLAIVSSLIVSAGSELFAFPQASVLELIRVSEEQLTRFDTLRNSRLFRLRDELVPVVTLSDALELASPEPDGAATLVICQAGASRFGIIVDDVVDTQEIVVKPVGRLIRAVGCYAGCTILGDGSVIMIVDPAALATRAGMQTASVAEAAPAVAPVRAAPTDSLLLVGVGPDSVRAVPLSQVERLEEISSDSIEYAGDTPVVQYRGFLLPLVPAGPAVTFTAGRSNAVIVCNEGSASFGIAVSEIRDIVDEIVSLEQVSVRPGILGTAVIGGAATEVLDVSYYMERARGSLVS